MPTTKEDAERDYGIFGSLLSPLLPSEAEAYPSSSNQGYANIGGQLSYIPYGQSSMQLSDAPTLGTAIGGGTYSTGLEIESPDLFPGQFLPLTGYSTSPIPAIASSSISGLLPGVGGEAVPYQTQFLGAEAAFPSGEMSPDLMQRVFEIGMEDIRSANKFSVEGATEGPYAQFDAEGVDRTAGDDAEWTNMTDEEVRAHISGLSQEERERRMPAWMTMAMLEDTQAKSNYATRLNETMAASSLSHARTTTELMGLLTGAMGMSEYADVLDRSKQMGEQVWSNFRNRGYDTSTAYASAAQATEQAKSRMMGDFYDKQLARRLGSLQMGNNIMQQAFLGVQRTPPDPMALAQIIYGQVSSGSGQQQAEGAGTGSYIGAMLGGGALAMGMRALTGWL